MAVARQQHARDDRCKWETTPRTTMTELSYMRPTAFAACS